jgi:hypothetical protein
MFLVYLFEYTTLSRQKQLKNGLAHLFSENSLTILNVYSKSTFDYCTSVGILIFKVNFVLKAQWQMPLFFIITFLLHTYVHSFNHIHTIHVQSYIRQGLSRFSSDFNELPVILTRKIVSRIRIRFCNQNPTHVARTSMIFVWVLVVWCTYTNCVTFL